MTSTLEAGAPGADFIAEIDHLVWASSDLDQGVAEISGTLTVDPVPGGSHPGLGTRNALLGLEQRQYFEILAPDPAQFEFRSFGRWIEGLTSSGLLTWAGRTSDMDALAEAARAEGLRPGPIESMSRRRPDGSSLSWKLMMIEGHDHGLLVPFFIQWSDFHPTQTLKSVARLERLRLSTPQPKALERVLAALGLGSAPIQLVESGTPELVAELSVGGRSVQIR